MSASFTKSTARNIFYGGAVFFFLLFLALTFDTTQALPKRDNRANLTEQVARHRAQGVMIDISALDIVDSFIGRTLAHIASLTRLLGASTVLVGMRPAVAITLVELGLTLPGVRTALNVERGMELLQRLVETDPAAGSPSDAC